MLNIEYLLAKRCDKLVLDVLQDAPDNAGNNHVPLGKNRPWMDQLLGPGRVWIPFGHGTGSEAVDVDLRPGPPGTFPAQTVTIQEQAGARDGEIKIVQQRTAPILAWSGPVRASRPAPGDAYVFLLRDDQGGVHARYLPDLSGVPDALRLRISEGTRSQAQTALSFDNGVVLEDDLLARVLSALRLHHNVILYGPPGTGKTYLMQRTETAFREGVSTVLFDPDDLDAPFKASNAQPVTDRGNRDNTEFVTFHASASYESFMVGLRPDVDPATQAFRYVVQPGPMLELAAAAAQPDSAALMLIDEINRGNAAEVFGELITVLEVDKRLGPDNAVTERTVEVRLPYAPAPPGSSTAPAPSPGRPAVGPPVVVGGRFRMPRHLYVLASMNSVDRTVAPLDSALRRRFQIIEVPPDLTRLRVQALKVAGGLPDPDRAEFEETARLAHDLLAALNNGIALKRGPDFRLGHSYLWPVVESGTRTVSERRAALMAAFGDALLPQLGELFRDRPDELRDLLGGATNEGSLFRFHQDPVTGLAESSGWLEVLPFPGSLGMPAATAVLRAIADGARADGWDAPAANSDATDDGNDAETGGSDADGADQEA